LQAGDGLSTVSAGGDVILKGGGNLQGGTGAIIMQTVGDTSTSTTYTTRFTLAQTGTLTLSSLAGSGSRTVVADTNGALSAPTSDATAKENVQALEYGINAIKAMRPVSFFWTDEYKNRGEDRQIGFIAQEMEQVIPEVVGTAFADNKKYINYPELTAVLTSALQEALKKIENLEVMVADLAAKVNQ
jgi:hypothetical protein